MNYYNEFDPRAATWLRRLIQEGLIPNGYVDERSIVEVQPEDLNAFDQCHFFAGIGGWPLALQLAEWPEDRPVWTASLPCQPWSTAGHMKGEKDERHLWPVFKQLIAKCQPKTIIGEQVASTLGRSWWAGVYADLENMGFGAAAFDLCAASIGAPHIRQRLFWVGHTVRKGLEGYAGDGDTAREPQEAGSTPEADGAYVGLAHAASSGCQWAAEGSTVQGNSTQRTGQHAQREGSGKLSRRPEGLGWPGSCPDWFSADWITDSFGKSRRIPKDESGFALLVDGVSAFMAGSSTTAETVDTKVAIKGFGNAIVPPLAAEFIQAYMEILHE